jgi:DNA-binding transcriptional LysR family regulator
MDIDLARTFLAVAQSGSFVRAADSLSVTQSTVSARIKVLENQLGSPVFTRSKAGASLTAAGNLFERHAYALVRVWQQARQEIALPPDQHQLLSVGAQASLWGGVMLDWLCSFREKHPEIAVRAETGSNDSLMGQLVDGLLDLVVIYTPQVRPGLKIEQLLEETLVLVSTQPGPMRGGIQDYVYVDWGTEFEADHAKAFPGNEAVCLFAGVGPLGLEYILRNGGTGYFPIRMVKPLIDLGRLHIVADTPRFHRPAYLVHYTDEENVALDNAVALLRKESARE